MPVRTVPLRPLVVAIVGIDGCGKSSTFAAAAAALAQTVRVVGIGDLVTSGGPGQALRERLDIPLSRSARLVGGVAKGLRQPRLYKNLKLVELSERARILEYVCRHDPPDVVLCDGSPLVNSAAWSAARFYRGYLRRDDELLRLLDYLSGEATIAIRDLPSIALRSWQLALVNRLGLVRMRAPDRVFLLEIEPSAAMARIRARGKPLQAHETEASLQLLAGGYERVCRVLELRGTVTVTRLSVNRLSLPEAAALVVEECLRHPDRRPDRHDRP